MAPTAAGSARTRRVLYAGYVIVASVGGAELGARWLAIAPPVPTQYVRYSEDDVLPFRPARDDVWTQQGPDGEFAFEVRTNSLGFRDVEHSRAKPDGVFRILALGDSFTFGIGAAFADTYLARLERRLNERPGEHPPIEIIKAGIPRYWPEPEAVLLERIGVHFDPDLVLVAFVPNDVADTVVGMDYLEVSDGFLLTREADRLGPVGLWLFVRSHAARIVLHRYVVERAGATAAEDGADLAFTDLYRANGPFEAAWTEVETQFERMAGTATAAGGAIAFVHIPQLNFEMDTASYPGDRLARWAEGRDVLVIDTLPAMRRASTGEPLYWANDGHCTPAGYEVIAQAVFDGLTRANAVP